MTNKIIKEYAVKAPAWGDIVEYYQARPGRVSWLANRLPVLRGEMEDTTEPAVNNLPDIQGSAS